jgi:twitching motility protein PilT
MSQNIYEIPMGDGEGDGVPRAQGRRAAAPADPRSTQSGDVSVPDFSAFPPPTFDLSTFDTSPPRSGGPLDFPPPAADAPAFPATASTPDFSSAPPPTGTPAMPAFGDTSYSIPAFDQPDLSSLSAFDDISVSDGFAGGSFDALTPPAQTATPAAPVVDRSPQPGTGQEGSHPDIVEALNQVVLAGASDLHISAGSPPLIRVDGSLRAIPGFPAWHHGHVSDVLQSIMTERQEEEFLADLEIDFAYQLSPSARFRVNMYQQRNHFGGVFRLIPTEIKALSQLGMPENIAKFAALPRGLVLVTGPTGSGKSTTLAAIIDLVNQTRADHIVTVEDPIEFMHENKKALVNQREVGHDTHSFQNALKHVLRQDPDVILIGELRDLETISVALTAAETGHLVFATLHTQDAAQSIDRILDVFPPHQQALVRTQLAGTLQGIVCQTLVKKVGGGRAVATEILVSTPAISNLIREGKIYQIRSMLQAGREHGMHTMDQHLAELVKTGRITHEVGLEKCHHVEDFNRLTGRLGGSAGLDQMQVM